MSKANRVVIRTYCETNCDCPNCHGGVSRVEKCVYCQLKWAGKGQYSPKWRKEHGFPPNDEYVPPIQREDEEILQEIIEWWKENS